MRLPSVVTSYVVLLVWAVVSAQEPPTPQFRAETELVTLDVTVLDSRRRPVRGLTAEDFVIVDGDARRPVAAFSEVNLPPVESRAFARPLDGTDPGIPAPDVATNASADGRLVTIMFDHSIVYGWPAAAARKIARSVIAQLGLADRAAVVFSDRPLSHSFTTDRAALLALVDHPSIGASQLRTKRIAPGGPFVPDHETGFCQCGLCSFDTITRVAQTVMDVPERRKVLVFIGGYLPLNLEAFGSGDSPCGSYLPPAFQEMFQAAQRANLTVYTFDPNGLNSPPEFSAAKPSPRPSQSRQEAEFRARIDQSGGWDPPRSPDALMAMADNTGGRAFLNTNAPEARVADVLIETGDYYLLGFVPRPGGKAGEFRPVRVEANRRGVDVRARRGYYVPRSTDVAKTASTSDRLRAALTSLLPRSALPLHLNVLPFAGADGTATVGVVVGIEPLPVATERRLLAGLFDADGREVGTVNLRLDSPASTAAAPATDDVFLHLEAPKPGAYHVRVAVEDGATQRIASVYDLIDVPDFARAAVSLSGLAMFAPSDRAVVATDLLPDAPTTRRTFARGEPVTAFVEVVQAGRDGRVPIAMTVRVLDAEGAVRWRRVEELSAGNFEDTGRVPYQFALASDDLPPGAYRVIVEAARGATRATRSVSFDIE